MAVFRVEKTGNYTVMSNYHLRDKRLSLKAKGLLSQMLSLPEDWDYTLTGLSYINRESKDAIRTAINELESAGYIERRQTTDEGGKFAANEYIIHECPVNDEPDPDKGKSENPHTPSGHEAGPERDTLTPECDTAEITGSQETQDVPLSDNPTTDESMQEISLFELAQDNPAANTPTAGNFFAQPLLDFPMTENPSSEKPSPENPTQINIEKQNKEKRNTDLSSTDSFLPSFAQARENGQTEGRTEISEKRDAIREQIEYGLIVDYGNREQINEFVEIMLEVALTRSPTIRINRDTEYPTALVQQRFEQINADHIQRVLDGIRENTTCVRNTRAYVLAALFNVTSTIDNHYTMQVNHDFGAGG